MSFSEWKEYRLGDIVDSISEKHKFDKDKIILINTSDVLEGKILNHVYVENENLKGQFKKSFKKGDILYSEIRPKNKRFAFVDFDSEDYVASTKLMVLRKSSEDVHLNFLFQILKSDNIINMLQVLAETRSGTFPQITYNELANLKIKLPTIKEQKAIANILSTLDEKIETNNKINKKLEEMAQAIFKHWFVDFEFPNEEGKPYKSSGGEMIESELGMIPKGWEVGSLCDLVKEIVTGKTPSTKKEENYGTIYPFITIPDMHGNIFVIKTERYLSEIGNKSQIKKLIPKNSIMVSCIATVGLVSINLSSAHTNQQINSIVLKKDEDLYYFYEYLKLMNEKLRAIGSTGSTTLNVNKREFEKIKYIYPTTKVMKKFYGVIKSNFEMVKQRQLENDVLINTRDTLLPKLMSGEIRVPLE